MPPGFRFACPEGRQFRSAGQIVGGYGLPLSAVRHYSRGDGWRVLGGQEVTEPFSSRASVFGFQFRVDMGNNPGDIGEIVHQTVFDMSGDFMPLAHSQVRIDHDVQFDEYL